MAGDNRIPVGWNHLFRGDQGRGPRRTRCLSDEHRRILQEESGISPQVIEQRGYYSETDPDALLALPQKWGDFDMREVVSEDKPALVIPVRDAHGAVRFYQVKFHEPPEGRSKYENPCRSGKVLDLQPEVLDPSVEIWISEGIKKADALRSIGLCAVGVLSTTMWDSPDLDDIPFEGRVVHIAFDSDIRKNPDVMRQAKKLRAFLRDRGAIVDVVFLPPVNGDEKAGVDDFLAAGHTEEDLRACISNELSELLTQKDYLQWMNNQFAVVMLVNKARILRERADSEEGSGSHEFLDVGAVKHLLSNIHYLTDGGDRKQVYGAWMNHPERRTYHGVDFAPGKGAEIQTAEGPVFNTWRGFAFEPSDAGSCDLFWAHVLDNVCSGDREHADWVRAWFAHLVQKPAELPGTAIVLIGDQGVGKSIVGETVGRLFHPTHYVVLKDKDHLLGRFNAHLTQAILTQLEEAFWAGDKNAEGKLKALITGGITTLERKGVDVTSVANYSRFLITSNSAWVVPAAAEERRFAVFTVGSDHMQDRGYFGSMVRELENGGYERLLHDLRESDLRLLPDPCKAPQTTGLIRQKLESLSSTADWWFQRLLDGELRVCEPSKAGPPSSDWPDRVLREPLRDLIRQSPSVRSRYGPTDSEIGRELRAVCPSISEGRGPRQAGASNRPRAYVLPELEVCRREFEEWIGGAIDWEGEG